jgi:hypothetical protein
VEIKELPKLKAHLRAFSVDRKHWQGYVALALSCPADF